MAFDAKHAVTFDLQAGCVTHSPGERLILIPAQGLSQMLDELGEDAQRSFGESVGALAGARVLSQLGGIGEATKLPVQQLVNYLAGELSILGLGLASVEQWGRRMIFVLKNQAVRQTFFLNGVVAGLLRKVTGAAPCVTVIQITEGEVRFFVGNEAAVARVIELVNQGMNWGGILEEMQAS